MADNYGPIHLSHDEAKLAIGRQTEAEKEIGKILLEAKKRVDAGKLTLVVV